MVAITTQASVQLPPSAVPDAVLLGVLRPCTVPLLPLLPLAWGTRTRGVKELLGRGVFPL